MESTSENLPERLIEFHRLGKDHPNVLIAAPLVEASEEINRLRAALTVIRDTLPERHDAYARLVFATAAEALEPETGS